MSSGLAGKRQGGGGGGGGGDPRRRKRQRYKQYSSTSKRKDLGNGLRGFLISCTPRHEVQCFRDAVILLSKHIDVDALTQPPGAFQAPTGRDEPAETANAAAPLPSSTPEAGAEEMKNASQAAPVAEDASETKEVAPPAPEANAGAATGAAEAAPATSSPPPTAAAPSDIAANLQAELSALATAERNLFVHMDIGVSGTIFVRVDDRRVDLEAVAASVLARARARQEPGCKHCIKIIPVHSTCYSKAADAAAAAVRVAQAHFPADARSYAIQFKSRMNTGAKRDEYIKTIADAVDEAFGKRYAVNLTAPDVVLIVEVLRTSCCVGSFTRFFELAKMNVREAAKPPKEKAAGAGDNVEKLVATKEGKKGGEQTKTPDEKNDGAGNDVVEAAKTEEPVATAVKAVVAAANEDLHGGAKVLKEAAGVDEVEEDEAKAKEASASEANGDAGSKSAAAGGSE